ncbi:aldehyde dehydrogenase (NAD+) [Sporobacter termitidis DSM 10068]|uniref:3-sulfolactaldehyde dehydrogenase n=1 Tax=Sporobacter termitidis DSM 10068 TaxID=1123282 RepID=A0A1M5XBY9_9FIRM|nr:aldehyde dehydrogenase family protein [Sporobacter termitidis]SHH97296.1 aldehyde dehydrogenase (NAD+) [Sporobacter termitidis DSM 10068]
MEEYKLFIAGEWHETASGKVTDDIDPSTGRAFARVHTAGPAEVELAVSAAVKAQPQWADVMQEQKEQIFLKAADYMESHKDEIVELLIRESGSTFMKAMGEVIECINIIRGAGGECRRIDGGVVPADMPGQTSYYIRQPLGVVAGIAPFNYPLLLALNKVAFAMAAGNAFILKPASDTPVSGIILAKCFEAGGLPKGVLSVIPGPGGIVGDTLVEDPRIKMVAFTGSTAVGRDIAVKAAKSFKKTTLEMGGKNPIIVLKDFDLDKAVEITAFGAYFHQGQICMAGSRIIVEQDIYDDFCRRFTAKVNSLKVGDPHDPQTNIGPLINDKQYAVLDAQIADAVSKGARLAAGGKHTGAFYQPSLLLDVTPEMTVFHEESFGPLACVVRARDWEDALSLCNRNAYGLSSAVLTNDLQKALFLTQKMESGMVHVNAATVMGSRRAPFGGVKNSGMGREDSTFSIEEFTELKWITMNHVAPAYPI